MSSNRPNKVINIGDIFGDMEVIEYVGKYKNVGNKQYKLKCTKCGKTKISMSSDINKGKGITHSTTCKERVKHAPINIGDKYGDMEIVSEVGFTSSKNRIYECKCLFCGKIKNIQSQNIYNGVGLTHKSSCNRENQNGLTQKHKRLYSIWKGMKYRVENENSLEYHRYGGRGILIEFKNFKDFVYCMSKSYYEHVEIHGETDTTIDRIDNDGNYSSSNCKWSTKKEQAANMSTNKKFKAISPDGKEFISSNQAEFAREHGLTATNITNCLQNKIPHHKQWKFKYI